MSRFDDAFALLIGHEGGFQANPKDAGNYARGKLVGTKYGISARSYPDLDIPNLTLNEARAIYLRDYWTPLGADELPPALALVAFDTAVHSGLRKARELLGETRDWGAYLDRRLAFIRSLNSAEFARGWEARLRTLRTQAATWEARASPPPPERKGMRNIINEAAVQAIEALINGAPLPFDLVTTPNNCLMLVRQVTEHGYGWADRDLYRKLVTERVDANTTDPWIPWATDAEKALRTRGLLRPRTVAPGPGWLVFAHVPKGPGHVGVIVWWRDGLYVLENAQIKRGRDLGGAINLVPLHLFGNATPITSFAQLPDTDRPEAPVARVLVSHNGADLVDMTGKGRQQVSDVDLVYNVVGNNVYLYTNRGAVPALPLKP